MKFDVENLLSQAREGRMEEYVHEFLRTVGRNQALSEGLRKQKRYWVGPLQVELGRMMRCCGPEESMEYRVDSAYFEVYVNEMVARIRSGWEVPPLILESCDGRLVVRDGNHRVAALERAGIPWQWALIWFNSLEELLQTVRFRPATFFVTGTSGAGKTTLVEGLKHFDLDVLDVHDFDEEGVPEGADQRWRMERTEQWLRQAIANSKLGKSTVICGVCVPQEIKNSPSYSDELRVRYGLVKADETVIRRRLAARGWPQELIDDNLVWAEHLERFVRAEEERFIPAVSDPSPETTANAFLDWIIRETAFLP